MIHLRMTNSTLVGCAILLAVAARPGWGQVRPVYGGHALDANMQVGSTGRNEPVPGFVPNVSNRLITGNIVGGRAFRGFSPIRDPSQLFVGLPSSSLSDFRRDSVSVADVTGGLPLFEPRPYFAPERTVTNVGAIRAELNQPGSSTPRSPYLVPRASAQPTLTQPFPQLTRPLPGGEALSVRPLFQGVQPGGLVGTFDPVTGRITGRLHQPSAVASLSGGLTTLPPIVPTYGAPFVGESPVDASRWPLRQPLAGAESHDVSTTAMDRLLNPPTLTEPIDGRIDARIDGDAFAGGGVGDPSLPWPTRPLPQSAQSAASAAIVAPTAVDGRARIGETFGARPTVGVEASAGDPSDPPEGAAGSTRIGEGVVRPLQPRLSAHEEHARRLARLELLLHRPLGSLVSDEMQLLDQYLHQAEELLAAGEYYRAASRFDAAYQVDRRDPRPLLGKGHALIGSGDFLSAVYHLQRGVAGYPGIGGLQLDLPLMMPHERILEQRRAELEERLAGELATMDRYRLQFLLGYIEVYSGLRAFGLRNLDEAATAAPEGSVIKAFPTRLRRVGADASDRERG